MAVYNLPRPNRPNARPNQLSSAADLAKPAYTKPATRPQQPGGPGGYQNELGSNMKADFKRPPSQSIQPIGGGFSGSIRPPVGQNKFGARLPPQTLPVQPPQTIQPMPGGFSGNANFGGGQSSQYMPWWYRNGGAQSIQPTGQGFQGQANMAPQNSLGSLAEAIQQFQSGRNGRVNHPTFQML